MNLFDHEDTVHRGVRIVEKILIYNNFYLNHWSSSYHLRYFIIPIRDYTNHFEKKMFSLERRGHK